MKSLNHGLNHLIATKTCKEILAQELKIGQIFYFGTVWTSNQAMRCQRVVCLNKLDGCNLPKIKIKDAILCQVSDQRMNIKHSSLFVLPNNTPVIVRMDNA